MNFQISIVIYNLIGEICTVFLCNKHNYVPACGGHAVPAALEGAEREAEGRRNFPSGGRFSL